MKSSLPSLKKKFEVIQSDLVFVYWCMDDEQKDAVSISDFIEKFWDLIIKYIASIIVADGLFQPKEHEAFNQFYECEMSYEELKNDIQNSFSADSSKKISFSFSELLDFLQCILPLTNFEENGVTSDFISELSIFLRELGVYFASVDDHFDVSEERFIDQYLNVIDQYLNDYNDALKSALAEKRKRKRKKKEKNPTILPEKIVVNSKKNKSDDLINELNSLIGLSKVKIDVNSLINHVKISKIKKERGLKVPEKSLHMVFMGNPGTGKTTVARLISEIYCDLGLLSKGQLIETDRSGLVAGYIGQTALKVKEMVTSAIGGILFIDEAYSLTPSKDGLDYGSEAINTLLKLMEDYRHDLVVIVAGYPELMDEFIASNPGLKSRFNNYVYFSDYTPEELNEIFLKMCNDNGLYLDILNQNETTGLSV